MKVLVELFQKLAGSWGSAPSRLRRGETFHRRFNLQSKYVLLFAATPSKKERRELPQCKNQMLVWEEYLQANDILPADYGGLVDRLDEV